jgi:hypothetical protein
MSSGVTTHVVSFRRTTPSSFIYLYIRGYPISFLELFLALLRSFSPLLLAFSARSRLFTFSFCPALVSPTIALRPALMIVSYNWSRAVARLALAVRDVWDEINIDGGEGR